MLGTTLIPMLDCAPARDLDRCLVGEAELARCAFPGLSAVGARRGHDCGYACSSTTIGPIGDAVGTTLEFRPRDAQPRLEDMTAGGPFELPPGAWTDDTAMALALADSLAASRSLDCRDLMNRLGIM